jgi:hypothetical protein
VLVELTQGVEVPKRAMDDVLKLADVEPLSQRIAAVAGKALRDLGRTRCGKCRNFDGPSLVDAVVMAHASEWAEVETTIVYTQDDRDLPALRQARFAKVVVKRV